MEDQRAPKGTLPWQDKFEECRQLQEKFDINISAMQNTLILHGEIIEDLKEEIRHNRLEIRESGHQMDVRMASAEASVNAGGVVIISLETKIDSFINTFGAPLIELTNIFEPIKGAIKVLGWFAKLIKFAGIVSAAALAIIAAGVTIAGVLYAVVFGHPPWWMK